MEALAHVIDEAASRGVGIVYAEGGRSAAALDRRRLLDGALALLVREER